MAQRKPIERTPDGRYVVIDGRRWHATNANMPEDERKRLVSEFMRARGDVGRVHAAKVALGERGPNWWKSPSA